MEYLRSAPTRQRTLQSEPTGADQVANSAGGYVWKVDALARLRRWLILGSEQGSYTASERQLTAENVRSLDDADPFEAIELVVEVSERGRAPKNDPALYALAYYAAHREEEVRRRALAALPRVARTGTHLFHFVDFARRQRGWGRALKRAIGSWYQRDDVPALAHQAVKYRQRDGWTHRDLLRLTHPSAPSPAHAALYDWIAHGNAPAPDQGWAQFVGGFLEAQRAATPRETARLVRDHRLPREALNTDHLTSAEVWDALLREGMPLGALVRNLPTMTRVGLLTPTAAATAEVMRRLVDARSLAASRVHPLQLLAAQLTYAAGHSVRGRASWAPVAAVVDALDAAFYRSFGNVEPTGKRHLLAVDVSGSMTSRVVNGVPGLTPRLAAGAMALVTLASGDPCEVVAFSASRSARLGRGGPRSTEYLDPNDPDSWGIAPLTLSARQRLDDAVRTMKDCQAGGTDCALPMLYALDERREVDVFVILTDSETWAGRVHPAQALAQYRRESGIDARLVVEAFVSNGFSIADPEDRGMLDVVGFDAATPQIISDFAAGAL